MARNRKKAPPRAAQPEKEMPKDERTSSSQAQYETMSAQAMEMWREQMGALLAAPQSFQDMGKAFEPFTQLFTQGMDLWLMMMQQAGQMARTGGFGHSHGAQDSTTQQKSGKPGAADASGATPAAALSGASAYAVAQLAARVADLEKRFDAFQRSSAGGPAAKPAASRRRGKAKVIALRPAGAGSSRA